VTIVSRISRVISNWLFIFQVSFKGGSNIRHVKSGGKAPDLLPLFLRFVQLFENTHLLMLAYPGRP